MSEQDRNGEVVMSAMFGAKEIKESFVGTIAPVRVSLGYRVGLVVVIVVMLISLAVYFGLLGWSGYLLWWHATHHGSWVVKNPTLGSILGYVIPLMVGGIFLLFMLKPLLARQRHTDYGISVDPAVEPRLWIFVQKICDALRAPYPKRIEVTCEVNASAGFRHGLWGMLRNDMVLTLGLPLILGLNTRQVAGILAHEMGHFAQGAGMRLTFLIRGLNNWLMRVVFERDELDERLESLSQEQGLFVRFVFLLTRGMIWLSRKMLWCVLFLGHAMSSYLLRQMEFDADRYQVRLVGSEEFAPTMRQVNVLLVAFQGAISDLSSAWQDGRLTNDFPRLLHNNVQQIPEEVLLEIEKEESPEAGAWWDTHPSDQDRIRCAEAEQTPGIFRTELPAHALFEDVTTLSRQASLAFYRVLIDEQLTEANLESIEATLARLASQREFSETFTRYFQTQNLLLCWMYAPSPAVEVPDSLEMLVTLLAQEREYTLHQAETIRQDIEKYEQAEDTFVRARVFRCLTETECPVEPKDLGWEGRTPWEVQCEEDGAKGEMYRLHSTLEEYASHHVQRLMLALQSLRVSGGDEEESTNHEDKLTEVESLLQTWVSVQHTYDKLQQMHVDVASVESLLMHFHPNQDMPHAYFAEIDKITRCFHQTMLELHEHLAECLYPFSHVNPDATVATYIVPVVPVYGSIQIPDMASLGGHFLERLDALFMRVVGRLVVIAEDLETAMELPPLPAPSLLETEESDQIESTEVARNRG